MRNVNEVSPAFAAFSMPIEARKIAAASKISREGRAGPPPSLPSTTRAASPSRKPTVPDLTRPAHATANDEGMALFFPHESAFGGGCYRFSKTSASCAVAVFPVASSVNCPVSLSKRKPFLTT